MKSTSSEKPLRALKPRTKRTKTGSNKAPAATLRFTAAVLMITVILALIAAPASATVISGDTRLEIEVAEITPNPARPGEDLLIRINIENTGNDPAENVKIGIEELDPFIFKYSTSKVYGSGTNTERIFKIDQIRQRSKVELNFHYRVDSRATSGVQQLEFTVEDGNGISFSKRIPILVEGNPDLVLVGTQIIPAGLVESENPSTDSLVPNQEFYLRTTVKNAGNGDAKNVRVSLDMNGSSPIITLEDNVRFLEKLEAGSSENLSFKLLLGSNAEVQPYKLPLRITASNEAETLQIDKAQEIGINVLNQARINIASLKFDPEIPVKGQKVSMIVRLENVGEGEARFVKAKLEGLDASGSTSAFLGRLDKDDDAPAVFTFIPGKTGEHEVTLLVEYQDDFGQHQLSEDLKVNVINDSNSKLPLLIGVLVVLAVAVFFMKKKGKL
ncbi:TPA: hypothetical protein HA351_04405 [Methanosarcinaceae archaeon]|nr:hypothetical protein [Methanosarcinaceae archaeon]